jgi:exodeoxyribonuclease-5
VFGRESNGTVETLFSGIADATARDVSGKIEMIVDWKSDVEMNAETFTAYRVQLGDYRKQTGAQRALLVLMTTGTIVNL